jgi:DNA helicase-2/ATP-dependent DNA helicase PcrA
VSNEDSQRAAVESADSNLLVIAPPGCGKTQLLAMRASTLVPRLRPNQKILALTFSNKAKSNLGERLRGEVGPERFRRFIKLRNFHGHSAEIIRAHGNTIGVDPTFEMPNRSLEQAIRPYLRGLSDAAAGDRKTGIENALREAKQQCLDDDGVRRQLESVCNEYAIEIERDRVANGLLHYDDLLRHAQRLLRVPGVANLYQHHYGAVLVDEFQDLSPQQLEITLNSCTTSRTFVGDPLQGIYTWAGARPAEVERELRRICGTPHTLDVSYRSSPAVLVTLSSVATQIGGHRLSAAKPPDWFEGGAAAAVAFRTGVDEGDWIAEMSTRILKRDATATIGVIARAAWRRKPIDAAFARSSAPFTRWDLAIENPAIVERLRDAAKRLGRTAGVRELEDVVLAAIDVADVETYDDAVDAIADLREIVDEVGSVSAAFQQLKVRDAEQAIAAGVHILNAHTGKGQQFDWVFIPGFEDFHIPSGFAKTPEEKAEEQRVLLVMLSRARHAVVLTSAAELISKRNNPYKTTESPWWSSVAGSCQMGWADFERHVAAFPTSPQ